MSRSSFVGYLYLIRPDIKFSKTTKYIPFKIGHTRSNPKKRLKAIQSTNWHSLELYGAYYMLDPHYFERRIHAELREKNRSASGGNEWFLLNRNDVKNLIQRLDIWVYGSAEEL